MRPFYIAPSARLGRSLLLLLILLAACSSLFGEDFTIVLLPDTQNYSEFYPQIFKSQTQWIADNAAAQNIKIVLGLGDIVNHGSSITEWQNADAAARLLDGKVPYLMAIGNHDYEGAQPSPQRNATTFNTYFGPQRYAGLPWYSANLNGSNENFYGTFLADGKTYLVLVLEYVPRNSALNWAATVAQANPDKEIIVVTHAYMYKDDTRTDACDTNDMATDNDGDETWNKFVSQYSNIIMVVSGHITSGSAGHRSDLGVNGNLVNQMLSNYQTWTNGGNGYLRILNFHPLQNTIDVKTYSPYLNQFLPDVKQQFTLSYHNPGFTTGAGTLSGRVRRGRIGIGSDCEPMSGVKVDAGGKSSITDSAGNYSLALAPGPYNSTATPSGWNPSTLSTVVHDGYTSDLEFFVSSCALSATSPSVTICTPKNGAAVRSPVRVLAGTTDNQTVTQLQAYVDGVLRTTSKGKSLDGSLPITAGTHRLTVQGKDSLGTLFKQTVSLTMKSGSTVSLAPSSANFGNQPVGTASSPQVFTLSNQGSTALQIASIATTGDFQVNNACGTVLAAGATCTMSVTFTPAAAGARTGSLVVNDSTAGSPRSAALSGTGGSAGCTPTSAPPSVIICTPQNGGTVVSPVHVTAATNSSNPVTLMQVYVDGVKAWQNSGSTVDTSLSLAAGTRRLTVQAKDSTGFIFKQTITISVH